MDDIWIFVPNLYQSIFLGMFGELVDLIVDDLKWTIYLDFAWTIVLFLDIVSGVFSQELFLSSPS